MNRPSTRKQYMLTASIYDKRGRLLSKGTNSYKKSHPKQAYYGAMTGKPEAIMLHAEVDAILRCAHLNKAHRIVIERYDVNGTPMLASPCLACQQAIQEAGIAIVEHT